MIAADNIDFDFIIEPYVCSTTEEISHSRFGVNREEERVQDIGQQFVIQVKRNTGGRRTGIYTFESLTVDTGVGKNVVFSAVGLI